MVLEPHHSFLGKNDLNTTGIIVLATIHATCCLLKMPRRIMENQHSACLLSPHSGVMFAGPPALREVSGAKSSCCPSPTQLFSPPRHNYNYGPFVAHACVCHACWEAQKTVLTIKGNQRAARLSTWVAWDVVLTLSGPWLSHL